MGDFKEFLFFYVGNVIQHCFIYRPSDSTLSEDAGIDSGLWHWQPDALTLRLDLIHTRLNLIHTRLDCIHTRLDLIIMLGTWRFIWNPLRRSCIIFRRTVGMLLLPFPALVGCCLLHPGSCCRPPHPKIACWRAVNRDHNNRKSSVANPALDPDCTRFRIRIRSGSESRTSPKL